VLFFFKTEVKTPVSSGRVMDIYIFNSMRLAAVVAGMIAVSNIDGRSNRASNNNVYTVKHSAWGLAKDNPATANGWFLSTLRMSRASFETIVDMISTKWEEVYPLPALNSTFKIKGIIAVATYLNLSTHFIVSSPHDARLLLGSTIQLFSLTFLRPSKEFFIAGRVLFFQLGEGPLGLSLYN
jgi:hypothetical protein